MGLAALAGCSADEPTAAPRGAEPETERAGEVVTLQPGLPGESATTGPAEVAEAEVENHSDIAFMQMMIPHHAQAIAMAKLAEEHAVNPAVRRFAGRVKAAQGPEILFMAAWLEERDLDVPSAADDPEAFDHSTHGHNSMHGMLSPAQMEALTHARGARFDEMFLRRMVQHHAGAVQMAGVVAEEGTDLTVSQVAADVSVVQNTEIARLRDLLRRL